MSNEYRLRSTLRLCGCYCVPFMPSLYSYILPQDMTWASVHMKSQGRRVPMPLATKKARQQDTAAEGDGGREI